MIESSAIWHEFDNGEQLTTALSESIASELQSAATTQNQVLLGLSGGTTPMPVYRALAQRTLPWDKIKMLLVDERYVSTEHGDSNERNIRQAFSANSEAEKSIIGLWSEQVDIESAALAADQTLANRHAVLDVVLLGMGEDGHFASLFPSCLQFDEAISVKGSRFVLPMYPMPAHAAHARLSMSLAYIQRARRIILIITGEKKRRVLQQAISEGDVQHLPIAALFKANSPAIEIYWSK